MRSNVPYAGEDALDMLADLLDPASELLTDQELKDSFTERKMPSIATIKRIIKEHKKAIIEIMAILDGENPETYQVTVFTLPVKVLEILNNPELVDLFTWQGQMMESQPSGSAKENTKDDEQ